MTFTSGAFPLSEVPEGKYRIIEINGGRGFVRRLYYMGLHPNVEISVTACPMGGAVIISLGGTQFGLGRGMASRVLVARSDDRGEAQVAPPFRRLFTLEDYREGQRGRIIGIKGEGKFKKRLLDMGFTRGAEV